MEELKRHCRKCLSQEMSKDEYLQWLQGHIDNMEEAAKATDEEYLRRLAVCDSCHRLEEGMCRACGCFVVFRCIGRKQVCPYGSW